MSLLLIVMLKIVWALDIEKGVNIENADINVPDVKAAMVKTDYNEYNKFLSELSLLIGREGRISEIPTIPSTIFTKSSKIEVYNIDMKPYYNKYVRGSFAFTTPKGTDIYVGFVKSENCPGGAKCGDDDKFYILINYKKISTPIKIKDIVNLGIFMQGEKKITIDDEVYTIKAYASISNIYSSRIEIKSSKEKVFEKNLKNLITSFSSCGVSVNLSKEYKIVYGSKIIIDNDKITFSKSNKYYIIEFPVSSDSSYYSIDEEIYSKQEITFRGIENYSFYIDNGVMKIYKYY